MRLRDDHLVDPGENGVTDADVDRRGLSKTRGELAARSGDAGIDPEAPMEVPLLFMIVERRVSKE